MTNNNERAFKSGQYNYDNQIPEERTSICNRCGKSFEEDRISNLKIEAEYFGDYMYNMCEECVDDIFKFANKKTRRD